MKKDIEVQVAEKKNVKQIAEEAILSYFNSHTKVAEAVAITAAAEASLAELVAARQVVTDLQLPEAAIIAALTGIERQEFVLMEQTLAVQTARAIALAELLNSGSLLQAFGMKDIHLRYTENGYLLTTSSVSAPKRAVDQSIPDWSTYSFGFTAKAVCDKLGLYVGNASANRVLYQEAKKQGLDIPAFLRTKGVIQ